MFFAFLQAFSSAGVFAGRAFLPALIASLLVRFGGNWPILHKLGLSHQALPPWFTHPGTIAALTVLSGLEFAAHRSANARRVLAFVDHWAKPVMAGLVTFGLVNAKDSALAGRILTLVPSSLAVDQAGIVGALPVLLSMAGTFWAASMRNTLLREVHAADPDDDTRIQRLFAWAEELWSGFGVVLMLLFPFVMAGLVAVVLATLYWLRRRAERREDAARVACPQCGNAMYRSAVVCHVCRTPNPQVHRLTWLGTTGDALVTDPRRHELALASKKRCPACATRLAGHTPLVACPACGRVPFADAEFVRRYDGHIAARLPLVLLIGLACSAVPIAGLLPGIILYRWRLVAPFRRYVPRRSSLLTQWGLRLLFFVLVLLHLIPAAGAITVPALAVANWAAYRRAFLCRLQTGTDNCANRGEASLASSP